MLKITAEEIHFLIYQYLHESGFEHSSFVFAQEANMHENRFNEYRIPSSMLVVFLEKALTLIHMETHLDDNEDIKECRQPYTLLTPHTCDISVEQTSRTAQEQQRRDMLRQEDSQQQQLGAQSNSNFISGAQQQQQQHVQALDGRGQEYQRMMMANNPALQQYQNDFYQQMMVVDQAQQAAYFQHQMQQQMQNLHQQPQPNQTLQPVPVIDPNQLQKLSQLQGQMMPHAHPAAQSSQMFMQQALVQNVVPENLEHNPEKGIHWLQADGENLEISSAQFNPKQRLLVAGGNFYMASLWDLRREPNPKFGETQSKIPHIKNFTDTQCMEIQADVSSVHWSNDGTRLLTSSNDMMARVWRIDKESGQFEIENVKSFNVMLMNSKFNKPPIGDNNPQQCTQLVATGGHSGVVIVWNADTKSASKQDVAKLVHTQLDPQLQGIEIDWQNSTTLAVTGKSKNIYLWSIESPQEPIQTWTGGHSFEVEQIKWDPSGELLASCGSSDNCVCLWKRQSSTPYRVFEDRSQGFTIVQWSNYAQSELLLAAGGQDGSITIWNCGDMKPHCKLPAIEREGGVKCMAFSPDNKMLATGGQETLCIWKISNDAGGVAGNQQPLKYYQKPAHFFQSKISGGVGTTGHGTQGNASNNMSREAQFQSEFSQVSWSHDGMLLAAAIHNKILVFDMRKISSSGQPALPHAKSSKQQNLSASQPTM